MWGAAGRATPASNGLQGALVAFLDGDALPASTIGWRNSGRNGSAGGRQCYVCGFLYSLPLIEYLPDPAAGCL